MLLDSVYSKVIFCIHLIVNESVSVIVLKNYLVRPLNTYSPIDHSIQLQTYHHG